MCTDGTEVECETQEGCPGHSECINGHFTRCIADSRECNPAAPDFVNLLRTIGGRDAGILVDANLVDDRSYVLPSMEGRTAFNVGRLESAQDTNEVIAFATDRAPTWANTPWSRVNDTFYVTLSDIVRVPITIWIVVPLADAQAQRAADAAIDAATIFRGERVGLDFSEIDIRDETRNPNAPTHLALNCTNPNDFPPLAQTIGFTDARINVYWIDTVDGQTTRGCSDGNAPRVAVGQATDGGLFAHEIGHQLALEHVSPPDFDQTNVMHNASNTRQFVTEGQSFRVHFHQSSALRTVYGLRSGHPSRSCSAATTTRQCVANNKRLWADGAFPAN
jgi:hypothetical protein